LLNLDIQSFFLKIQAEQTIQYQIILDFYQAISKVLNLSSLIQDYLNLPPISVEIYLVATLLQLISISKEFPLVSKL
jgi:hypothetical protein